MASKDWRATQGALAEGLTRTRWGRAQFGGLRLPALWSAACLAVVLAAGFGLLAVATGVAGSRPLVGGIVFALAAVGPFTGLVWALIVDRRTLQGASARPEESVESAWFDSAAGGSFTDTVMFTGIALTALALTDVEMSAVIALTAVLAVAGLSFGIRFLLARRQGCS